MPIKYIGRTNDFRGKTLWEILGNLKNFGVGRIVTRSRFERYPEPSYLRIVKVVALPNEDVRKVKVTVERTFRGKTYPKLAEIDSVSYKPDYRLIPKDEEASYCKIVPTVPETILPRTCEFPPLLKEIIIRDMRMKGEPVDEDFKLQLLYKHGRDNNARVAEEGETPTREVTMGLGKPASPNLYSNIH